MFGPTLSGNAAACKYFSDAVEFSVKSIAAFAAGDTDNAKALQAQAKSIESYAAGLLGIQRFCEVCILLLLISVYVIVGFASYRIIALALRTLFRAEIRIISVEGATKSRQLLSQAESHTPCPAAVFISQSQADSQVLSRIRVLQTPRPLARRPFIQHRFT